MRNPNLDGLRGLAVLLVLGNHFGVRWLDGGGTVGVQLFFVLSGYLITSILLSRTLTMREFYVRRARRLLPALLLVCAVFGLLVVELGPPAWRPDAVRAIAQALTFTTNLHPLSQTPWLGHTWSLAVEDQFYLVWPLFAVMIARGRFAVHCAIAVISAEVLLRPLIAGHLPIQVWNWDALMAGCMVARFRLSLNHLWGAIAGWAILIPMAITRSTWILDPHTLSAIGATLVLLGSGRLTPLRWMPLRHVGTISYSLYLWHYVFVLFWWFQWWVVALSFAAAEASYFGWERRWITPHRQDASDRPVASSVPLSSLPMKASLFERCTYPRTVTAVQLDTT